MFTGSIKISELDSLGVVVAPDFFPVVRSGFLTTYRVTINTLNDWWRISGSAQSASWASQSLYAALTNNAVSASHASSSISSSYSLVSNVAYSLNYTPISAVTASFASASLSSSYALTASFAFKAAQATRATSSISSSWASASLSSLTAISASYAPQMGNTLPIGTIIAFGGLTVPSNWLECNGDALLTSSFGELYQAISSSNASSSYGFLCDGFGNRNAAGAYFKLPDLRGEFLRGWDHNRGIDIGRIGQSAQTASLGSHYHGIGFEDSYGGLPAQFLKTAPWTSPDGSWTSMVIIGNSYGGYTGTLIPQGSTAGNTNGLITSGPAGASSGDNRPRNIATMYCIKYTDSPAVANTGSSINGDVIGTLVSSTVVKLRNIPITSSIPVHGDVLTYNSGSGTWQPSAIASNANGIPGKSYLVAYPGGTWCTGDDLYVYNNNVNTARKNLVKINMTTNVVTYQVQWPQDAWNAYGHIFRKTTDSKLHLIMASDTDVYDYDIDGTIVTRLTGSGGNYHDNPVQISWASGSLRPTIWSLYGSSYALPSGGDIPNLYVVKLYWNGSAWVRTTSPLLTTTGVGNGTEWLKFCNQSTNAGAASQTLMWDYNYIKKRYYLIDNSTSYLHIFSQTVGDIVTNFNTASISYEKTLAIPMPSTEIWTELNCEKMTVDYDADTGEERGICMVRRGTTSLTGAAIYVFWPE